MLVIDAHVHLWERGVPRAAHRQAPFTASEALAAMDVAGIDAAILVAAPWDPGSEALCREAARGHAERFVAMAQVPLQREDGIDALAALAGAPEICGLRYILNDERSGRLLEDRALDWLWSEAAAAAMPVALAASRHLRHVDDVARRFPRLRLLIDHLAVPIDTTGPAAFAHLPQLLAMARRPNVALKATAVPSFSDGTYPYPELHPYLEALVDAYGPDRFFWGSDITKLPCTWLECRELFTRHLPSPAPGDRERIMGRGICDWLPALAHRWRPSPGS